MNRPINCKVKVRIIEHDVGRLSAEFESNVLKVGLGRGLHDLTSNERGSRECDLVDVHVPRNGPTDGESVTRDDIHDAGWEAGLVDDCAHAKRGQGGEFRWLEHNAVSGGEGWAELPCQHQNYCEVRDTHGLMDEGRTREVPGKDLSYNSKWLVPCVRELALVSLDDLSVQFIRPTGIVPYRRN